MRRTLHLLRERPVAAALAMGVVFFGMAVWMRLSAGTRTTDRLWTADLPAAVCGLLYYLYFSANKRTLDRQQDHRTSLR